MYFAVKDKYQIGGMVNWPLRVRVVWNSPNVVHSSVIPSKNFSDKTQEKLVISLLGKKKNMQKKNCCKIFKGE